MTENEAIIELHKIRPRGSIIPQKRAEALDVAIQAIEKQSMVNEILHELREYSAIGTIEDFKALKEKSVAKKPHSISIANDIGNSMVECPICHARSDYDVKSIKRGYCWKCGQKLDWSE